VSFVGSLFSYAINELCVLVWWLYGERGVAKILSFESIMKSYSWFQTYAVFWMSYSFFWVISRPLNFMYRHCGTLCQFYLYRWCKLHHLWRWDWQSVPKPRYTQFRRGGITQKEECKVITNIVLDRNIQWHANVSSTNVFSKIFKFPSWALCCKI